MPRSTLRSSVARLALVALAGSGLGACTSDATRFSDPFGNPFTGSVSAKAAPPAAPATDVLPTGSIPSAASRVETQDLAPPPALAQARPPAAPAPVAAAPAPSAPRAAGGPAAWSTNGGTPVTLGQGETVAGLATRYGVPEGAIRSANGLAAKGEPPAGARVVIPVLRQGAAAPSPAAPVAAPAAPKPNLRFARGAQPAQTPAPARAAAADEDEAPVKAEKPAPKPQGKPAKAKAAAHEADDAPAAKAPAKVAAAPAAPARKPEPVKAAAPQPAPAAPKPVAAAPAKPAPALAAPAPKAPKPAEVAAAKPAEPVAAKPAPEKAAKAVKPEPEKVAAKPEAPKPEASKPAEAPKVAAAPEKAPEPAPEAAKEGTDFRWPARGRVIQGFGQSGGGSNDGINIAVPSGTPVRAAEGGTVAYAGEELKGYGKLVLVRHADGWVSAYAHNGELNVKKGQAVKRGEVIAKSGQTGNVASPQLHFELRKGSSPVDPTTKLSN